MAKRINDLPRPNQSRIESYLGVIAEQEGAVLPDEPKSRIEEYLEYIAENGGGSVPIRVGIVTNDDSFPTTRSDGSDLVDGDYVGVSNTSTFPFTIETCTFNSSRDRGIFFSDTWTVESGIAQVTSETPVADSSEESLSGEAETQNIVNQEFKERIETGVPEITSADEDKFYRVTSDGKCEAIDVEHETWKFTVDGEEIEKEVMLWTSAE